mgnify:FL=1
MDDYTSATYGNKGADLYDDIYPSQPSAAQLDLLAELVQGGRALELGIGTGRLAIPLVARGVAVEGLDSSEAMVSKMHAKDVGSSIPVTISSFERFDLNKSFDLIFVAFNTIFSLLTQDAQVSCFESVTRHLSPSGVFLVEAFVPDLSRFDHSQRTSVSHIEINRTIIDTAMHSLATQRVDSQHIVIEDGQPARVMPVSLRYSWPAELDLMARLAGLRLRNRWADWDRSPFGDHSDKHVSIWSR